jgi:hypothetical protein
MHIIQMAVHAIAIVVLFPPETGRALWNFPMRTLLKGPVYNIGQGSITLNVEP